MSRKIKISVRVEQHLLDEIDSVLKKENRKRSKKLTRSNLFNHALKVVFAQQDLELFRSRK